MLILCNSLKWWLEFCHTVSVSTVASSNSNNIDRRYQKFSISTCAEENYGGIRISTQDEWIIKNTEILSTKTRHTETPKPERMMEWWIGWCIGHHLGCRMHLANDRRGSSSIVDIAEHVVWKAQLWKTIVGALPLSDDLGLFPAFVHCQSLSYNNASDHFFHNMQAHSTASSISIHDY